jgi:prepilin-type N-terminal cleavage/methylation domain-containing protein
MRQTPRGGFTLIELLVVIGIVMVLAAIVFPIGQAVQENQRARLCVSNLQALGRGLRMYQLDYMGFPPGRDEGGQGLWGLYGLYIAGAPAPGPATTLSAAEAADATVLRVTDAAAFPEGELVMIARAGGATQLLGPITEINVPAGTITVTYPLKTAWPNGSTVVSAMQGDFVKRHTHYRCPDNPVDEAHADFAVPPLLGGYNGYDAYYQRSRTGVTALRQLSRSHPPADTVVTWCIFHRRTGAGDPATGLGNLAASLDDRDRDLVLWLDGSVERMPAKNGIQGAGSHAEDVQPAAP